MITNIIKIDGMTCGKCAKKIEQSFATSSLGFKDVKVTKGPDTLSFSSESLITPQSLNIYFKENELLKYSARKFEEAEGSKVLGLVKKLFPLILIVSYILLVVVTVAFVTKDFSLTTMMPHYMSGFFITFSFFKFLNINGFVDAFNTYDPMARKWRSYGYFYAFFELFAGVAYLIQPMSVVLNVLVIILLTTTSFGVWKAVRTKTTIQCACLGTVFNLPMTYVTIFENMVMILMAVVMVVFYLL